MPSSIEIVIFSFLAISGIVSSFLAVTGRNLFRSFLFFGYFLLSVAGFYFLLKADFIAMVQIIVYVGGILVLILFFLMLTPKLASEELKEVRLKVSSIFLSLFFFGLLVSVLSKMAPTVIEKDRFPDVLTLSKILLTKFSLPFEVAGVILLVALVGVVVLIGGE